MTGSVRGLVDVTVAAISASWSSSDGAEKVMMVAPAMLVGGGFTAAVVGIDPCASVALDAFKDNDIALPGVDGLSSKVLDGGAALTLPAGLPGTKLIVEAKVPKQEAEVAVLPTLDLAKRLDTARERDRGQRP